MSRATLLTGWYNEISNANDRKNRVTPLVRGFPSTSLAPVLEAFRKLLRECLTASPPEIPSHFTTCNILIRSLRSGGRWGIFKRMSSIGHNVSLKFAIPALSIRASTPCQRITVLRKAQTRTLYHSRQGRSANSPARSWESRRTPSTLPPRRVRNMSLYGLGFLY